MQNIFSLSLIQRWRAAKTGVDVAGFEAEVTKRDVMATAGLLYMEASRAEAAVKARLADLELSQQLLKLAQDRKQAGVATGLDVTREVVQLENTRQRLLVAQNDHESAKLNLIRALGIDFNVTVTLTDELTLASVEAQTPETALSAARENRAELKAQLTRQKLASLSLSSVTSERIPSLSLSGDYGWIGLKPDEALATRSVGLMFSVPIFDGGQRGGANFREPESCAAGIDSDEGRLRSGDTRSPERAAHARLIHPAGSGGRERIVLVDEGTDLCAGPFRCRTCDQYRDYERPDLGGTRA